MAQRGNVYEVKSVATRDFLGALAQGASASVMLQIDEAVAAGWHSRSILRSLRVLSVQNLAWDVAVYATDAFDVADPDTNRIVAWHRFTASDGVQLTSGGLYVYFVDQWDVAYSDEQSRGKLYLLLINRSPTSKLANAAGAVQVQIKLEPTYG